MTYATGIAIAIYTVVVFVTIFCRMETVLALTTITIFCLLGFGFLIAGILMIRSVKEHFVDFHAKVSNLLWLATLLLAIPMFIRGVNWAMLESNKSYKNWYYKEIAFTDASYLILTTIVPVCAQLCSMIFGAYKRS